MQDLSELHDCDKCDKCHGKIVAITVDLLGVTRCSYCGEVVDYVRWFNSQPEFKEYMKAIKNGY